MKTYSKRKFKYVGLKTYNDYVLVCVKINKFKKRRKRNKNSFYNPFKSNSACAPSVCSPKIILFGLTPLFLLVILIITALPSSLRQQFMIALILPQQ